MAPNKPIQASVKPKYATHKVNPAAPATIDPASKKFDIATVKVAFKLPGFTSLAMIFVSF
jgi:hypothetical protein